MLVWAPSGPSYLTSTFRLTIRRSILTGEDNIYNSPLLSMLLVSAETLCLRAALPQELLSNACCGDACINRSACKSYDVKCEGLQLLKGPAGLPVLIATLGVCHSSSPTSCLITRPCHRNTLPLRGPLLLSVVARSSGQRSPRPISWMLNRCREAASL